MTDHLWQKFGLASWQTSIAAATFLVSSIVIGMAAEAATVEDVVWTNLVNVTASGGTLEKTAGCDGCDDAGAISWQSIPSGDGYVEFTMSETTTMRVVGLSNGNSDTTGADIDFGLKLWPGGGVDIRENGVYRAETSSVSGDVFRIAVDSGVVTYAKNGNVFHTTAVTPIFPLLVDTSLWSANATISNVVVAGDLSGGGGEPPPSDTIPPVRSNGTPTGTLPAGTSQATLGLTTDETATCRHATTAGVSYAAMTNTFSTTGGTSHATTVTGLANGNSYAYYVKCQDSAGNANSDDFAILFSVASADGLPADFEETVWAVGLSSVTAMEFSPDGRLFVAEQAGRLRIIKDGVLLSTPFLTVSVSSVAEQGLLGVAFDPNFGTNRYVYVYYTAATGQNRVSRFTASTADPDVAAAGSEVVILDEISRSNGYHNGGAIHFGADGKLYVAVGDGGENPSNSQSLDILAGKLLRIDPSSFPDIVPPDNPFVGTAGARDEIWALGLRNPFTFAVEPGTGKIHINDVGAGTWEEINLGRPGANYGWPECEGVCSNSNFDNPIHAYPHDGGSAAITGGAFYRASQFPAEYVGSYFFADFVKGVIRRLTPDNQAVDFAPHANSPVDLKIGPDGSLFYLSVYEGDVYRIRYVVAGNRNPVALAQAVPTSGLPPLQVNFSGAGSSDPDGDVLRYTWDFGDGSALEEGAEVTHTYLEDGPFVAMLTVDDGRGGTASDTVAIAVGNPPVGTITRPLEGTTYNAGETIFFEGTADDAEDGALPASAFSWTILFHHLDHTHPFLGPLEGVRDGSFTIPQTGETDDRVWYRIYLTVRDSSGLTHVSTRDVLPNKSTMTLATEPSGLQLTLDGSPVTSPHSIVGVVGMIRELGAPSPQDLDGRRYEFVSWSDGSVATSYTVETPPTDVTYTATYGEVVSAAGEAVTWTNLVNVTASGTSLQKTGGCDGCEDAGAVSSQTISSGDGFVEFTASEVVTQRALGLSHGNADTSRADIDFAIQLWPGGGADVRENGLYRAETTYVTGDVFRIAVESGVVKYSKNGTVFHTSTVPPTFPLLVDTTVWNLNGTITNVVIFRGAAPAPDTTPPTVAITSPADGATVSGTITVAADASDDVGVAGVQFFVDEMAIGAEDTASPYSVSWDTTAVADGSRTLTARARDEAGNETTSSPVTVTVANGATGLEGVVWTSLVNVTANGNSLKKTGGCEGCEDAGAVSSQTFSSGDGFVEFDAFETTTSRVVGLSHGNADTSRADIDFGIQLWPGGGADVRENGLYRAETTYVTGDVFRVAVESGVVKYSKNGSVFHTSTVAPTFPLLVDATIQSLNGTITNAVISRAGS